MADEGRRTSSRATKGQHTKSHDLDIPAESKRKSTKKNTKKAAAAQQEDEEELIRCVCGAIESLDSDPQPWIACDQCTVWQHNICVGIPTFDDDIPDNYWCEQCKPEHHKELLDGIARGLKPWIDRRKKYDEEQEAEAAKKKGKKGKKRTSGPNLEVTPSANGKAKSPSTPVSAVEPKKPTKKEAKKETPIPVRAGSTKRTRDESHDNESAKGPPQKRRVSEQVASRHDSPPKSPVSNLPVKILDLDSGRQPTAKLIKKQLMLAIPISIEKRLYTIKPDDSIDAKAERLAIQIEDALHVTYINNKSTHAKQSRAVVANLKQNQELCDKLLTQKLSPTQLASMSTDEMASTELKEETARMKELSDKQAIMITDDGPRIRRTHKGDEIIGGEDSTVADDTPMATARRRSMLDPNAGMAARSRENSPMNEVELPENIDDHRSHDDIRSHVIPKPPLNIQTKPQDVRKASTAAQDSFDIQKVFSSVQSPVGVQNTGNQQIRRQSGNAPPANGPGVDPEIDKMLQDDGIESPPYSPVEYAADPDTVWRGTVTMDSVAKFPATAKHVAGADLSGHHTQTPWADIMQSDLKVAGRIDQDKANEYLCSIRYSPPTDVVVVALTASGEEATESYFGLFKYFHDKKRYGVLTNKGVGNIRDTYLVPVPASPDSLPDFIVNLEGHRIPEERPEPLLLVALVIRPELPSQSEQFRSFDGPAEFPTPTSSFSAQRHMSLGGGGPQMSPIGNSQPYFPSPAAANPETPQSRPTPEQQRILDQREGEAIAHRILGPFVNAPTVSFLMPQAYQMRTIEWEAIRKILERDPQAQDDLQHLSRVLDQSQGQQVSPAK